MRRNYFAFLLLILIPASTWGQSRDFRTERIIVDDDNGNTVTIEAPGSGMTGDWTLTLPPSGPTAAGQALTSDGSGGYSWQAASGGGSIPTGFMIIGTTSSAPSGYSSAGTIIQNGTDVWIAKEPPATIRFDAAVAEANGKLYLVGGDDGNSNVLTTTEEYDPATNTWSTKAAMPTARDALTASGVGGKIYVIGGENAAGNAVLTTNEEYDPATNTWTTKAAMPTARRDLASAVAGGKIYVIGGRTNASGTSVYTNANEEYDPVANTWAAKTVMPDALREVGVASLGGKIYTFGGAKSGGGVSDTREYDPGTNAWTGKSSTPIADFPLSGAVLNNQIYVVGPNGNHSRFDPVTNLWEGLQAAPSNWQPFIGGYHNIGGLLYAVGTSRAVLQYTPPTLLYLYSKN